MDNYNTKGENYRKRKNVNSVSGSIYGLAFIGAFIYYIHNAVTLWMGIIGFFKALIWPAFLIYKLMEFLKM